VNGAVIVFDVDDTLYLERDYVRSGFHAVGEVARERLGIANFADAAWELFESGARGDIFDRVLRKGGFAPAPTTVREMVDIYRSHPPAIHLAPDARECLAALAGRYKIAVITDGPAISQRAKLTALGASAWSAATIVTDELGPGCGKPNPMAFRLVQEAMGVEPRACTYVADNPAKDFRAPHALGWGTIRCRRPEGLHRDSPSGNDVGREVSDLRSVIPLLQDPAA
jgi:putative hydrolase of the HAD superfamily